MSGTPGHLAEVMTLVSEANKYTVVGSLPELRLQWLAGKVYRRLERFEEALAALGGVQDEFEHCADGYDRALLLVDLAETYLAAGDAEAARELALSSFSVLQALRNEPEAYKALRLMHQAASDLALDRTAIESVRSALLAARR